MAPLRARPFFDNSTVRSGVSRQRCPPALAGRADKRPATFAIFATGRASPKTQKFWPFFEPVSSKQLGKCRMKLASSERREKYFCGTLMGPPRRARKSKSRERESAATRSGAERSACPKSRRDSCSPLMSRLLSPHNGLQIVSLKRLKNCVAKNAFRDTMPPGDGSPRSWRAY